MSEAAADAHLRAGMVNRGKLCVIPNGVDVEAWRPNGEVRAAVRQEFGVAEEFLWLAVGRFDPVKDYPTLLKAVARLPETALLVIAGNGPLQNELTLLSACLGLERRVRFLGYEPDVRRWMRAADGFVLSSRWEGLPMALLEAGACALPTVATDVPGTHELLLDGVLGTLTSPGDEGALAKAMAQFMQIPAAERLAMGEQARQRIVARFSMESVLDRWEDLYADLLDPSLQAREARIRPTAHCA